MKLGKQEPFEKPASGEYVALLIDVIDKPNQPVTYGGVTKMQDQITFVWALGYPNGAPAVDKNGRQFQVFETYNAFINPGPQKPSKLYVALVQILNAAPPVLDDTNQIEKLVLGRQMGLMVLTAPKVAAPTDNTTKIIGHMPLKPGQVAPSAPPKDFVRYKDRQKQTAGPKPGQTTQTFAQPPQQQQPAAPSVNLNANEAF